MGRNLPLTEWNVDGDLQPKREAVELIDRGINRWKFEH